MKISFDNLHNAKWKPEEWQDIFDNIISNANKVLHGDINQTFKNPNITIDFIIDDLCQYFDSEKINACAMIINEEKYKIIFTRRLIQILSHFSRKILDYDIIFKHLKRTEENREKLMGLSDTAFYIWVQFIFYHEWSHIVRGHLATNNRKYKIDKWFELSNDNVKNKIKIVDIRALEADADRWGSSFMIGNYSIVFNDIYKMFYTDIPKEDALYDYILMLIFLFDLFDILEGKSRVEKDEASFEHPEPEFRALLCITTLIDNNTIELFSNISKESKLKIVQKASLSYFLKFRNYNETVFAEKFFKWQKFMSTTGDRLEKMKINKKTLFKK